MNLTIVPIDKVVHIDGVYLIFDFDIDPSIHAVQWDGEKGEIEHKDRSKANTPIDNIEPFMDIARKHAEILTAQNEQLRVDTAERVAFENTYRYKRSVEYPPGGDQFDMLWHSMHSGEIPKSKEFYDKVKEVKDKFPKEE
ncbi:MAG: hypothetical protein KAV87_12850 [Desulfobacteraceae bacterium]|nr:hypothetical protein [Desulfobacteraceae bacterium]